MQTDESQMNVQRLQYGHENRAVNQNAHLPRRDDRVDTDPRAYDQELRSHDHVYNAGGHLNHQGTPNYECHEALRFQAGDQYMGFQPYEHYLQVPRRPYDDLGHQHMQTRRYRGAMDAMPAFSGKENWQIYINRFEAIAERQGWTERDKLDFLIPKLTGEAAELVFMQLPKPTLHDYGALVKEIHNRFRTIETPKSFAAKFSQRNQGEDETALEYASELKRLYDKAYKGRDILTRKEDLLRRFLDGLIDGEARWQVEYVKNPGDIDEAVYEVVSFIQLRERAEKDPYGSCKMSKYVRRTCTSQDAEDGWTCTDSKAESHIVNRAAERGNIQADQASRKEMQGSSQPEWQSDGAKNETDGLLLQLIQKLDTFMTGLQQPRQHYQGND